MNVLFVCTGNSARSILAESILNREGEHRFNAYSAGSNPTGTVHPLARAILERRDFSVESLRSKSWDEFAGPDSPHLDYVITVCDNAAGEVCPVWPGQPPISAHWGLPDPAAVEGSVAQQAMAFALTFNLLSERISTFVKLPFDSLDEAALQQRLDDIGRPEK